MFSKKIVIALLSLLMFPTYALPGGDPAPKTTQMSCEELMRTAHLEGKKFGYPETIQGILLQETDCGRNRGPARPVQKNPCYGVMQLKLNTAKFVITKLWRQAESEVPSDRELRRQITNDDALNIKIAASYFNYLISRYPGPTSWEMAVLSYNIGISKLAKKNKTHANNYLESVRKTIKTDVREFNSAKDIALVSP